MNLGLLTLPQRVSAIAMAVTVIGAFLPWVSFLGASQVGVAGDGSITLIAALAGLVLLALSSGVVGKQRQSGKVANVVLLVLAVVVALVGFLDMNGFAAIGLYLTLLGGIAWVVGAIWQMVAAKNARAPEEEVTTP